MPRGERRPVVAIAIRLGLALSLVLLMTLVVYADRGGYYDARGGEFSFLDSLYYTTVSISTTGYGDIVPATDGAGILTALVMTPPRLAFILILVGTTLQVLTERSTTAFRTDRWEDNCKTTPLSVAMERRVAVLSRRCLVRDTGVSRSW